MDRLLKDLNEAQKEAVLSVEGPVMAIAGAGSGKTRVLTRRIAHLIDNVGVPKDNILAITFTNKAADEMKTRIASLLSMSTYRMWISTFHSMCARILREHIEHLGYTKNFQIIDDDDVTQMIKIVMKSLNLDVKTIKPNKLKPHILNLKSAPETIESYGEPLATYLHKVFPLYQKKLKENNLVDFEDLLVLTIRLLEEQPQVRKHYQQQFQYLLVDEFQDTNNLQYDLIRLLSDEKGNVFIVGDEDQSIYAFRGANIDNIRKFNNDYKNVKTVLLEKNYRSTNTILKAANQVISENKNRIEKTLHSTRGDGEKIRYFKGYSARDEVEYIADTIEKLHREGYAYEDMAILYRANSTSRMFEEGFMHKRLPYKVIGNTSFFKRKEIKDIVAYLRLVVNEHDDYSFRRIVNEPRRGIGATTVEKLANYCDNEGFSHYEAIEKTTLPVSGAPAKKLKAFKNMIETLQKRLGQVDFNVFLDDLLDLTGYKKALENDERGDVRYENIQELKTMLKETENTYATTDKETLLTYVLEDIALKSQEDEKIDSDAVSLMTLHAAKGLEFPVVFIAALEQGMFPLYRSLESSKDLEEERRLMYVGLTRAQQRLFLTNAKRRQLYGESVANPDSMFLKAIDPTLMKLEGLNREHADNEVRYTRDYNRTKRIRARRESLNSYTEKDLNKGDKIVHKAFGEGVVVSVARDQCVIAFSKEHGLKTLMKNHPAIVKKEE